jgi:hypothetical protein
LKRFRAAHRRWLRGITLAVILLAGCGGSVPVSLVVDEAQTISLAEERNYRYCLIRETEVCQSPDSQIVFHMPKELLIDASEGRVEGTVAIENDSFEPIVLESYFIDLLDDRNFSYRPDYIGPSEYDRPLSVVPALTLRPGDRVEVRFTDRLRPGSKAIRQVTIVYRLEAEKEYTRVTVSYRSGGLDALQDRRNL